MLHKSKLKNNIGRIIFYGVIAFCVFYATIALSFTSFLHPKYPYKDQTASTTVSDSKARKASVVSNTASTSSVSRGFQIRNIAGLVAQVLSPRTYTFATATPAYTYKIIPLTINDVQFQVQLSDTDALQELGLGNRAFLSARTGMLFVFDHSDRYSFWMKDMEFPLDIIWADEGGTIIYIQPSLSPNSYPQSYAPRKDAMYVLEISAGESDSSNIKIGDKIVFDKSSLKKS